MYLLDTTHCIKIMSGDSEPAYKLSNIPDVQIATCSIVRVELMFGIHNIYLLLVKVVEPV